MFSLRLAAPEIQQRMELQILLDDTGDDSHRNAAFFINVGDGKTDIILFPRHAPVIAGVRHGVDPIGKADINHSFVYIRDLSRIFALNAAFLEIVPVGVFRNALNVCLDG